MRYQKIRFFAETVLLGVARGSLGLIFEYPFETIKTQWQNLYNVKTQREIINIIYREKGIIGFYRGFVPTLLKNSTKNVYRWPLMVYLPNFYTRKLKDKSFYKESMPKILTGNNRNILNSKKGFTLSIVDVFGKTPFERLSVFYITTKSNSNASFRYFYKTHYKNGIIYELFKGAEPNFWRSNISWFTFLYIDFKLKTYWKRKTKRDILFNYELLVISVFVGIGNTITSK